MATFPVDTMYDPRTTRGVALRALEASFGDGYRQRAGDGINTHEETHRIVTLVLNETDFDEVDTFLKANAGKFFDWTPPLKTTSVKSELRWVPNPTCRW